MRSAVFAGRFVFEAAEHAAEIAHVAEAARERDVRDTVAGGAQHLRGALDAVVQQIVDGRAARELAEHAAEVLRVEPGVRGELVERQRLGIFLADALQRVLDALRALFLPSRPGRGGAVQLLGEHFPEQLPQKSGRGKFVAGLFLLHRLEQRAHELCRAAVRREHALEPRAGLPQPRQALAAHARAGQKALEVEHDALVDAAVRMAAVDGAVGNERAVARAERERLAVQRERKRPAQHEDELMLHVPVERHLIAGV